MRIDKEHLLRKRTGKEVQAFVDANPEVQRWLRKVSSPLTKNNYARDLMRYVEATELSPAQLIALKQKGGHEAEDLLDEFVDSADKVGLGDSRTWSLSIGVKSFYKWNYADLSRGAGKKSVTKKKPYRTPDKESLIKFMEGANMRDRALIQFLASTGIAEGSIPHLTWGHVWTELIEKRIDVPHIGLASSEIKGRGAEKYAGVEQHTFMTPSAADALLRYKEWRERNRGETVTPQSPLFATVEGPLKPLTAAAAREIFNEASKRTGIKFSPHDMRRFVQTQLEFARMQPNWIKKILRHKIKGEEQPYSQPKIEELRKAYRDALTYMDLAPTPLLELQKRNQVLERINSKIAGGEALTDEDRTDMVHYKIRLTYKPKELKYDPKRRRFEHKESNDCTDGQHCGEEFEQIKEGNLLDYLRNGWAIVHRLENGEVIVKKNGQVPLAQAEGGNF